jgi:hypothetical protein
MTRYAALLASLLFLTAATAQEPKAVKTAKVMQSLNDTALYEVKDDGTSRSSRRQRAKPHSHAPGSSHAGDPRWQIKRNDGLPSLDRSACDAHFVTSVAETIVGQASVVGGDTLEIHGRAFVYLA